MTETHNPLGVNDSYWHYFYPDGSGNYPPEIQSGTIFCKTLFSNLDYGSKLVMLYHMDTGTYYTLVWHKAEVGNATSGWEPQWHKFGLGTNT